MPEFRGGVVPKTLQGSANTGLEKPSNWPSGGARAHSPPPLVIRWKSPTLTSRRLSALARRSSTLFASSKRHSASSWRTSSAREPLAKFPRRPRCFRHQTFPRIGLPISPIITQLLKRQAEAEDESPPPPPPPPLPPPSPPPQPPIYEELAPAEVEKSGPVSQQQRTSPPLAARRANAPRFSRSRVEDFVTKSPRPSAGGFVCVCVCFARTDLAERGESRHHRRHL